MEDLVDDDASDSVSVSSEDSDDIDVQEILTGEESGKSNSQMNPLFNDSGDSDISDESDEDTEDVQSTTKAADNQDEDDDLKKE